MSQERQRIAAVLEQSGSSGLNTVLSEAQTLGFDEIASRLDAAKQTPVPEARMKWFQSAVDALLILLLIDYVQDTGVLAGMSRLMRNAALAAILFPAVLTLNALWARAERASDARRGFKS